MFNSESHNFASRNRAWSKNRTKPRPLLPMQRRLNRQERARWEGPRPPFIRSMTRYGLQAVTDNLEGDRRPPELQHFRGEMVAAEVKAHRVELVNNHQVQRNNHPMEDNKTRTWNVHSVNSLPASSFTTSGLSGQYLGSKLRRSKVFGSECIQVRRASSIHSHCSARASLEAGRKGLAWRSWP